MQHHIPYLKSLFECIGGYSRTPIGKLFLHTHTSQDCEVHGCTSAAGAGSSGAASEYSQYAG
jgi:hypothetical protein